MVMMEEEATAVLLPRQRSATQMSTCDMHRHSNDDFLFVHPGPVDLIYGAESPLQTGIVARHLSSLRRRRKRINHLSFLASEIADSEGLFRLLGKKLKRIYVKELAINQIPSMRNDELISLASFFNCNKTLRSIDFSGARFDVKALQEVRSFFKNNRSLEVLVMGDNECIGDEGAAVVISALQEGKGALRTLSMQGCGLGRHGSASISNFLRNYPSLQTLELSDNKIGDAGVELLAESIKSHSCKLQFLGLNAVEVGDLGALYLACAVKSNLTLKSLSLQNNRGITSFGAVHLLKATYNTQSLQAILCSNHVLTNLNLRGCSRIGPSLLRLAEELLSQELTANQLIRFKVSKYMKTMREGVDLGVFDLKLLPHIISFVGLQTFDCLFNSIKSMPPMRGQHVLPSKNLTGKAGSKFSHFVESLRASRRAKKVFEGYTNSVPKQRSIIRRHDRRCENKHAALMKSHSSGNNKHHNLSLSQRRTSFQ